MVKEKEMENTIFVCLDCELTGLDPKEDRIVEIALVVFNLKEELQRFETLIDPQKPIPPSSIEIHHITDEMVQGKPAIYTVLPEIAEFIGNSMVIGHNIAFDLAVLQEEAKRHGLALFQTLPTCIDTFRLARIYGESQKNSLQDLRQHFNLEEGRAHRAMSDVEVNIAIFKQLIKQYKTVAQMLKKLEKPIELKIMPLGKYKGRPLQSIPLSYLYWLSRRADFDKDLTYSIRKELSQRKEKKRFSDHCCPFKQL